jgi:hypothetical protein
MNSLSVTDKLDWIADDDFNDDVNYGFNNGFNNGFNENSDNVYK